MKIKKFFIDNKSKIIKILENLLYILIFFVIIFSVYSCGFISGAYIEKSEESIKQDINYFEKSLNIEKKNVLSGNIETLDSTMITNIVYSSMAEGYLVFVFHIDYVSVNYYFTYLEIEIETSLETRFYYTNDSYVAHSLSGFSSVIDVDGQYETLTNLHINIYPDVIINEGGLYNSITNPSLDLLYNANLSIYNEESVLIEGETELEISYTFEPYIPNPSIGSDVLNFLSAIDDYGLINMTFNNSIAFNLDVYDVYYDNGYRVGYNEGKDFGYDEGYEEGYLAGLPKNIFYYNVEKDSPILLVLDDTSWIQPVEPDDYDENLLFKNNYLDLQYLRDLYSGQYTKFRVIFTDSLYSLKDLYLSLDNSSLNDYNILVNGKAYTINSSGTLNIPSSDLLQAMEFDSSLLDSTRLINASPDYANGFNNGYSNGYDNGYSEAEIDQDDYFRELIIPAVKVEYEEIGYNKGYEAGKNDALNSGTGLAVFDAFSLIGKGFEVWNPILNIQVLPGMSLGVFIAIPIVIAVVMIVIKLLQR